MWVRDNIIKKLWLVNQFDLIKDIQDVLRRDYYKMIESRIIQCPPHFERGTSYTDPEGFVWDCQHLTSPLHTTGRLIVEVTDIADVVCIYYDVNQYRYKLNMEDSCDIPTNYIIHGKLHKFYRRYLEHFGFAKTRHYKGNSTITFNWSSL